MADFSGRSIEDFEAGQTVMIVVPNKVDLRYGWGSCSTFDRGIVIRTGVDFEGEETVVVGMEFRDSYYQFLPTELEIIS